MDAIRKSKIRLRINSFSAVIIPYLEEIVKCLRSTRKICGAVVKENARRKSWIYFRKSAGLPQPSVVCCCADRKGGTTYEKYDKRAMARKHRTARGQPNQLTTNEGTPRLYGTASRGSRKELHGRAERNLRKVPRLLERVYELSRGGNIRVYRQVTKRFTPCRVFSSAVSIPYF